MQKKKNLRLPSCPRDLSRRLHPFREPSSIPEETLPIPDSLWVRGTAVAGKAQNFEGPISRDRLVEEADSQGESVGPAREIDPDSETESDLIVASIPVVQVVGQPLLVPSRHIQQPQRRAMEAVINFFSPPIFRGSPDEDARQWLKRYETISTHNGWGNAEKQNNFRMYLDDTARNWFLCARTSNDWEETTAQPAAGGHPAILAVPSLRSMFLKEFQPDN